MLSDFGQFNEQGGGGGVLSAFGRFSEVSALSADPVIQSMGRGC